MSKRLTTEEFIFRANKIHNYKYDYSKSIYKTAKHKIIIICPIHGEFEQIPHSHLSKRGCPYCGTLNSIIKQKKSNKIFILESNQIHNNKYNYTKTIYKNAKTKIIVICPIHGEFYITPNSHLRGIGCPKCNSSKGELKIEKYLTKNNIQFTNQKRFSDCRNKQPLPFDFYLPEHNCCIEYDGEQHFKPKSCFGGIKQFQRTKQHNLIKNQYCSKNNIQLIRIPYTKLKNIKYILSKVLICS